MKWSLNLGKFAGIRVLIHWSFPLILIYVVYMGLQMGLNTEQIIWYLGFVLTLFLCVVLHEYGHALTARRYGIATRKITLLPIGGVASLEKMPEEPHKELVIAVMGPVVNVVIALVIWIFVPVGEIWQDLQQQAATAAAGNGEMAYTIGPDNFFFHLFLVNVLLVVFNAIPAFPMDGGRILRALLAMKLERTKATQIAASLGQMVAIGFAILGIFYNPFLILIGLFVFFGAYSENMIVQHLEHLRGYYVKDAMMTNISTLHPYDNLQTAIDKLLDGNDEEFIIVEDEEVIGVLRRAQLLSALKENGRETRVASVMDKNFKSFDQHEKLTEVFNAIQKNRKDYFPVLENKKLVGVINAENLNEFVMIQSSLG